MPVRYVIDKEQQLVITTGSDRLTFAEIKAHQDQLLNDPDFNEAKTIARRRLFSPTSRRAFVTATPTIFGMGRMMQAYNELSNVASQVRVFYDHPSALKWLGLERRP